MMILGVVFRVYVCHWVARALFAIWIGIVVSIQQFKTKFINSDYLVLSLALKLFTENVYSLYSAVRFFTKKGSKIEIKQSRSKYCIYKPIFQLFSVNFYSVT